MESSKKTDVIVVGGGPAGISAAITIARCGKKVILIERGNFCGSKNVFGGAVYTSAVKEIFPDFEQTAPLERKNIKHNYALLDEADSTIITYSAPDENSSYTVVRAKFDRWMAEEAKKCGVILVTETVVEKLIQKEGRVVGVTTELEDYYADIVILADGVNSLLARQVGLRKDFKPKDMAIGVKEVIKLTEEKINERFGISSSDGVIYEIMGGPMLGMLSLGYIYTNKDSVTIGLGAALDALIEKNIKPYELLDQLKAHPALSNLIKDGELIEYSAHLIPESGYKKVPRLYADGVMIIGDSAMLVNNLHWEGTNLAMISGKYAGETAVKAIENNDFSANTLSLYKKKLENSFVLKDLKTYKNLMDIMHSRSGSFLNYQIKKINQFFKMFTSADGIPKRTKYHRFATNYICDRSISEIFKDMIAALKLIWGILR